MFVELLFLILVAGILYKLLGIHGCGAQCQRRPAPGESASCQCLCSTCPCSPLQAFQIIPKTLEYYYNQAKERLRESQVAAARLIKTPTADRSAQSSGSFTHTSPFVIDTSRHASQTNFNASYSVEASTSMPPASAVLAACNKCKSKGVACSKNCPKVKAMAGSTSISPGSDNVLAACNKCRLKARRRPPVISWSESFVDEDTETDSPPDAGCDLCQVIKYLSLLSLILALVIVQPGNPRKLASYDPEVQCLLCKIYITLLNFLLNLVAVVELICGLLLKLFNNARIEIARLLSQTEKSCCDSTASGLVTGKKIATESKVINPN